MNSTKGLRYLSFSLCSRRKQMTRLLLSVHGWRQNLVTRLLQSRTIWPPLLDRTNARVRFNIVEAILDLPAADGAIVARAIGHLADSDFRVRWKTMSNDARNGYFPTSGLHRNPPFRLLAPLRSNGVSNGSSSSQRIGGLETCSCEASSLSRERCGCIDQPMSPATDEDVFCALPIPDPVAS